MRKETKIINYTVFDSVSELPDDSKMLLDKATNAMQAAHAPYSKFKVGAAVQLENDVVVLGSNQENIAYPSGLCAERVALFAAGANYPNQKILRLAIVAEGALLPENAVLSPCGACRQVMAESASRQGVSFEIILLNPNGSVFIFDTVEDVLPFIFGV